MSALRRSLVALFCTLALTLTACSSGTGLTAASLSEDETFICELVFTEWTEVDVDEVSYYQQQTAAKGWQDGGAYDSAPYRTLEENGQMAAAMADRARSGSEWDPDLRTMTLDFARAWALARDAGHTFMAVRSDSPNSAQMADFTTLGVQLIEAGTQATKLRGRCLELGYEG